MAIDPEIVARVFGTGFTTEERMREMGWLTATDIPDGTRPCTPPPCPVPVDVTVNVEEIFNMATGKWEAA